MKKLVGYSKNVFGAALGALTVLTTFAIFELTDVWKSPEHTTNIVMRRIAFFWVQIEPDVYEIGAVIRLANLSGRTTVLKSVRLDPVTPLLYEEGQTQLRGVVLTGSLPAIVDDAVLNASADVSYKFLLPTRLSADLDHLPAAKVRFVGDWKLVLRSGERSVEPEYIGTFERPVSLTDWRTLNAFEPSVSGQAISFQKYDCVSKGQSSSSQQQRRTDC